MIKSNNLFIDKLNIIHKKIQLIRIKQVIFMNEEVTR